MRTYLCYILVLLFVGCGGYIPASSDGMPIPDRQSTTNCNGFPDEGSLEDSILGSSSICNECVRKNGYTSVCGSTIIAAGSCNSNPLVSYYRETIPGTNKLKSYWYKNKKLIYGREEVIGQSEALCTSGGNAPCTDFSVQIVWCR